MADVMYEILLDGMDSRVNKYTGQRPPDRTYTFYDLEEARHTLLLHLFRERRNLTAAIERIKTEAPE